MKNYCLLLFLVFVLKAHAQQTRLTIANGKIEGAVNADKTVAIFKGIPFAAAPVGKLRWQAPQPVKNWEGLRSCSSFSASPMQAKPVPFLCWTEEFIAQPEPLSEDCLYLNVWTAAKSKNTKLPVFVWIYGGGLVSGSSNCAVYDGEAMAKKGVVFVSINYRVGVFGFMAHPALTKESANASSGNYGILDQVAALQWVKKNIAAFGGDPGNVTIDGQSAGSFSVNALIASPLAKGLFHKAIAQSGGILSNRLIQSLEESEKQGLQFMEQAKAASMEELRARPAADLLAVGSSREAGRFGLTLDGYVLPVALLAHFEKGLHNQTPLLTGWVTGDAQLFGNATTTLAQYQQDARSRYADKADVFLQLFPAATDEEAMAQTNRLTLFQFAGVPSHLLAGFDKNNPAYFYQFGHVPPAKPGFPDYGAFHTSEVPYALHTLHKWNRSWQPTDLQLENMMSSYWVNFAKTGNPNGPGLPEWKPYQKETGIIMEMNDTVQQRDALYKKQFDFLESQRR